MGQLHLFLGGQQLHLTDLLQVHAHGVVQAVLGGKVHRIHQLFLLHGTQIQLCTQAVAQDAQTIPQVAAQHIQAIVQGIQVGGGDLDVHSFEPVVDLFYFLGREIHLGQDGIQVRIPDHAFFFALGDQRLQRCLHIFHFSVFLCSAHEATPF